VGCWAIPGCVVGLRSLWSGLCVDPLGEIHLGGFLCWCVGGDPLGLVLVGSLGCCVCWFWFGLGGLGLVSWFHLFLGVGFGPILGVCGVLACAWGGFVLFVLGLIHCGCGVAGCWVGVPVWSWGLVAVST